MCATHRYTRWDSLLQTITGRKKWSLSHTGLSIIDLLVLEADVLNILCRQVVVRQQVADKLEKCYLERGTACYLFALDNERIIDSSVKGNTARFINHCCEVSFL